MWRIALFLTSFATVTAFNNTLKIGFIENEIKDWNILSTAVTILNDLQVWSPKDNITLMISRKRAPAGDTGVLYERICTLIADGAVIIFTDKKPRNTVDIIPKVTNNLHVPFMDTHGVKGEYMYMTSIYPYEALKPVNEFLNYAKWKKMAILYDANDGNLADYNSLIQDRSRVVMLKEGTHTDKYMSSMKMLKNEKIYNFIIDIDVIKYAASLFKTIIDLDMDSEDYSYFFISYDTEFLNFDVFCWSELSITAFSIVNKLSPLYEKLATSTHSEYRDDIQKYLHSATNAMYFDAMYCYLQVLTKNPDLQKLKNSSTGCHHFNTWRLGERLQRHVGEFSGFGLTGPIIISKGKRTGYILSLIKIDQDSTEEIGLWVDDKLQVGHSGAVCRSLCSKMSVGVVVFEIVIYILFIAI